MNQTPTIETYPELQRAFNYFNEHLFDNKLTSPLFTLESHARFAGYFTKNKFQSADGKRTTHQIALNPAMFHETGIKDNLSTLVHEMCHQYQTEYGEQSRRSYHDKQWAQYMEERGLIPSHTGLPGGKKTGQKMTHYIEEGGRFDVLADQLIESGFNFAWHDPYSLKRYRLQHQKKKSSVMITSKTAPAPLAGSPNPTTSVATPRQTPDTNPSNTVITQMTPDDQPYNSSNRVKYICLTCAQQCWGKRGLKINCANEGCDNRPFEAENDY